MNKDIPSVNDYPVSPKKRDHTLETLKEAIHGYAFDRALFTCYEVDDSQQRFQQVGLNVNIEKIWFVENPPGNSAYAYQSLGSDLGRKLGLGEFKSVVDSFIKSVNEQSDIIENNTLTERVIDEAVTKLIGRGRSPTAIVTNIHDADKFWSMNRFIGSDAREPLSPDGHYKDIPVYVAIYLPQGTSVIYDKKSVASISFKDKGSVGFSEDEDGEHVNILAKTVFKFSFEDSESAVVIRTTEED